jgi:hypothetical protein
LLAEVEQTEARNAPAFLNAFSGISDVSATDQSSCRPAGGAIPHRASIAVDGRKTGCPQQDEPKQEE